MNDLAKHAAPERTTATRQGGGAPSVLRGDSMPHLLRDELLCEIFAQTAAARPDALCMTTLERRFTYREVDARSCEIARGLLAHGAGPGKYVGLWMARGPELLIAQLAIAKTGAAWLPFDADAPMERIAACLADAGAPLLLTSRAFAPRAAPAVAAKTLIDAEIAAQGEAPPSARERGAAPGHPAFLIYTSGSTGAPKGVVITHRNICHYLRAANEIYGVTPSDTLFQGASIAFDLSVDETWLAFLAGAALFVATPQIIAETDALPDLMEQAGVTVLDAVPTLLAALPRDVTTLRMIILGGEACPPSVAERWSRDGRKIYNSYGPTEATIVATVARVRRNEAVTIGRPIPNYSCYVASETLELRPAGAQGELLIGGPGIAEGYLNRIALTAEKFIANPFAPDGSDPILYRTGDAVVLDENGHLAFRGRIDDQIKIRGFRVELGEIEAALGAQRHVRAAAVALRNENGLDELVAFLTTDGPLAGPRELRENLRRTLPPYMVPSRFEAVASLPKLSSGKIDRKALELLPLTQPPEMLEEQEEPRSETEAVLLAAAQRALPPGAIPFDADFFTDLGGHSLLAARFVSLVRATPRFASVTLQDLYVYRNLRALAAHLDGRAGAPSPPRDLSFEPPPLLRRFLCGLAQLAALPFLLAVSAAQWLSAFLVYELTAGAAIAEQLAALVGVHALVKATTVLLSIAGKWLVLGRTKPGRYPLWGAYYYRWWLSQRLIALSRPGLLQGSPLMRLYLMALGARIGEDAMIGDMRFAAIDLVTIGAGVSLGSKADLANARVEGAELVIGAIGIGAGACIGASCVIEEDAVIGEGAELSDLTSLPSGARVGAYEIWDGSPARRIGTARQSPLDPPPRASAARRFALTLACAALALVLPPLGLAAVFPALWTFHGVESAMSLADSRGFHPVTLLAAWPAAAVQIIGMAAFTIALRWLILPRVSEGTYSIWSWFYLRKWAAALSAESTLDTLSSLYSTLYMRLWQRLMGARIGKGSEIYADLAGRYDLVEVGENCFIADDAMLGGDNVRRGWMHSRRVTLGDRAFIGNDAVVSPGADIPSGALIGVKSKPPANAQMSKDETWFGSPPIKMPAREKFDAGAAWTYAPPLWKKILRAGYEAPSVTLPAALFIVCGAWTAASLSPLLRGGEYVAAAIVLLLASALISLGMTAAAIMVKWITMGRYAPQAKPLWSFWAMRTETCAVLYWGMAGRVLLEHLRGAPFLPWALRLWGAKFGQGVYLDTIDMTEFDCVETGDYCALNSAAGLQTHLYEDRVMKVGRVTLGKGVTAGAGSIVLYDSHVGDYARLGPLTVVMKGESIPAHSEWVGAPAEAARRLF